MSAVEFGPIEADEIKAVRFDFSTETSATPITVVSVTVTKLAGAEDPDPDSMKEGSSTVVGLEVVQKLQPTLAGREYKIRAVVDDAEGLRHGISGEFSVTHG